MQVFMLESENLRERDSARNSLKAYFDPGQGAQLVTASPPYSKAVLSPVRHTEAATSECISKWDDKLMLLSRARSHSLPSSLSQINNNKVPK